MSRHRPRLAIPALGLDRSSEQPLQQQVFEALREAILAGRIRPGSRLPSSRVLASEIGAARNTVMLAYQQLLAEAYAVARVGAGTAVAETLPEELLRVRPAEPAHNGPPESHAPRLSRRGHLIAKTPATPRRSARARALRPGYPALDHFPIDAWARLAARRWRTVSAALLDYGDPAGLKALREAIAAYLGEARGVRADAGQVVIVSGSQQAVDLAARLLLDPGDRAWLEDPGYLGARGALLAAGARLVPVPVDHEGLVVADGIRRAPDARLAYVTPSHQFPLGVTMSAGRRLSLLDWATRARAWIVEDDYDSEYRYGGRPLTALAGLDRGGRVIYVGTFSKVLFPALRLGYLVLPPGLVDAFVAARALTDRQSPTADQAILADFIGEGHFARHLRRMRALYADRQAALLDAVARTSSANLDVRPQAAGMHLIGWLPPGYSDRAASEAAAASSVDAPPLSTYRLRPAARGGLLLGYTGWSPREIQGAVGRLVRSLEHQSLSASPAREASAGEYDRGRFHKRWPR
jgi:GntR family transcriptional regulator/MocR family aminotransferase